MLDPAGLTERRSHLRDGDGSHLRDGDARVARQVDVVQRRHLAGEPVDDGAAPVAVGGVAGAADV